MATLGRTNYRSSRTSLRTEVVGGVQRLVLATGIIKPEIDFNNLKNLELDKKLSPSAHLSLKSLNGSEAELGDLKGKVIFFNVWASWCPPCIAEMPNIENLYKRMDKTKVAFVMLSVDKDQEKARNFITRKGYTFPVYFPAGRIPPELNSSSIPATFVLDTSGNIVYRNEGMANYDNREFEAFLLELGKGY